MLLPRSDPTVDSCSGHTNPCAYDSIIPTYDGTSTNFRTSGSYGYMGITMVVILALLAGAFWLYLARKRAMRAKVQEANQPESKQPRRPLFTIGSRKPSHSPPATASQKGPEVALLPKSTEKHSKRASVPENGKQPRWVSQSGVRKGLVKEVSGGMVVYTARPKPTAQPPRRDRRSRRESRSSSWHMEHMGNVAHEVSLLYVPLLCD